MNIDLGCIPENLFESELFGYEKGAFTDARNAKEGRIETADGGTLFLDEIGNLNLPMQQKLLTVIEKRETQRIGSNKVSQVDVRLGASAKQKLLKHNWLGNVRELQHCIERAIVLGDKTELAAEDIRLEDSVAVSGSSSSVNIDSLNLQTLEREAIARAILPHPKLILADEPTGNLDSKNGKEVMELLSELHKEGTTIVMVTHSLHDANYADRIINMFDGEIVNQVEM